MKCAEATIPAGTSLNMQSACQAKSLGNLTGLRLIQARTAPDQGWTNLMRIKLVQSSYPPYPFG